MLWQSALVDLFCFVSNHSVYPIFSVQTIAFLAWLRHHNREKNGYQKPEVIALDDESEGGANEVSLLDDDTAYARPHLIVVPASVLTNWEREFETFCPSMHIIKYHGSMTERADLQQDMRKYLPSSSGGARQGVYRPLDVVLTTFSYFSSEKADDRTFLRKFQFDYLVLDEAHCLKNPRGARYRNLDKFETSHRLLLTGKFSQRSLVHAPGFEFSPWTSLLNRNSGSKLAEGTHVTSVFSHALILSVKRKRFRFWRRDQE